jgi:hypothetical protein
MWKVLSVQISGALQDVICATPKYKIGLLAVQEVKWLGRSISEKKN